MIINPGASRTLDPAHRSFVEVVGLHDKRLTDADVNLLQSVQDWKRRRMLENQVCSGVLSFQPFVFTARTPSAQPLAFSVPAFDVLMNGQVVTIGGNLSASLQSNLVRVPAPSFWAPGATSSPVSLYVAYIEFWYQRLNALTGEGYAGSPPSSLSIYPNGCVNAQAANWIPNDTIDAFITYPTTERIQLQWAIRVTPVDPAYDFSQYNFGLDPGATSAETVYAQAGQSAAQSGSPYQFGNLGGVTGDAGLWRAGDGNYLNSLGTADGYSYAMPLAVIFQRNTGFYSVDQNPFGTADPAVVGSGSVIQGWTARFDGKFADVIFPEDVVDTRSLVSLAGWDREMLLQAGFTDVISGQTRLALARGETPGNSAIAAGSLLDYAVSVAPSAVSNTDTVGAFDGYRNGFSAADATFYSTQTVTVNQKATGTSGARWVKGDSFSISLAGTSGANIEYAQPQALVNDPLTGANTPVMLLPGQVSITGLGTQSVTIQFTRDLGGTSYDPGLNPIYVTLGVDYPANGGVDLRKVPNEVYGGTLLDGASGQSLPVFGVSDYAVQALLPTVGTGAALAYNPNYSDLIFGTRVSIAVAGSTGSAAQDANGNPITLFTVPRSGLPGRLTGLYVLSAVDQIAGTAYTISGRTISGDNAIVQIQGSVSTTTTLTLTFLAASTAQLAYNAAVKAVTTIEETIVAGTGAPSGLTSDQRVAVVSVQQNPGVNNIVVLAATGGMLTGIAGDDTNKLIFVQTPTGDWTAVTVLNAVFLGGFVTLTVPPTVNLEVQEFFVVGSLVPAFVADSQLSLVENYVPYQGEGRTSRDYEIVRTEDIALVTTNGTGMAPVPGLRDVYPYDRELPISTTLPAQASWSDATLLNQPVASFFDSNFVGKAFQNVQHTFEVPAHGNDFIEPVADGKRKSFQLSVISGGRGYAKASPHMGFAIAPITPRTSVGEGVTSTIAPVTLYVNNVTGNDNNDGLTVSTAFLTIGAALNSLPSVLRNPCSLQLIPTGVSYSLSSSTLQTVTLGDGVIRSSKYYALGILCFTIQEAGRLVITAQSGTKGQVTIDATGFAGFGDGPTAAFFIDNSRVIFNQIEFKGFNGAAIKGLDADVEFVDCLFTNNLTAASFEQASTVIVEGGTITLGGAGVGFILAQSELEASGVTLAVSGGAVPGPFFVAERNSSLTLDGHAAAQESNVSASTVIAQATLNSSIATTATFSSQGSATLSQNSALSRSVSATPFGGGVNVDVSSFVSNPLR